MTAAAAPHPQSSAAAPGWIRRLLGESWRYRRVVVVTMIFTLVAVGVDVLMPLLTKAAIDHATGVVDDGLSLRTVIIALVVFAVVRYACHLGRRVFAGRLAVNVQNTLRLRLLDTLLHLDGRSQHQIRTGQIVSRSISDIQVVQSLLVMAPLSLGAAVQMVVALAIMAYLSPLLTGVALLIAPLIALEVWRTRRRLFAATWSAQQAAADVAQHVEETVTGVRVVKGFGQEKRAVDDLITRCRTVFARRLRAARIGRHAAESVQSDPVAGSGPGRRLRDLRRRLRRAPQQRPGHGDAHGRDQLRAGRRRRAGRPRRRAGRRRR